SRVADGGQLVDAAKRRLVVRGTELRADAPDSDCRALPFQALDQVLIEIVRGDDHRPWKAGFVEELAGLNGQPCEIAGVESNADQLLPALAQVPPDLDRIVHALDGVVGVDQEYAVVR